MLEEGFEVSFCVQAMKNGEAISNAMQHGKSMKDCNFFIIVILFGRRVRAWRGMPSVLADSPLRLTGAKISILQERASFLKQKSISSAYREALRNLSTCNSKPVQRCKKSLVRSADYIICIAVYMICSAIYKTRTAI